MYRLVAISTVLSGLFPAPAQTPKAVIEGVVINAATKTPVAGAQLRLAGKGAELESRPDVEPVFATTDAAGRFVFEMPAPDLFILQVRSPGSSPIGTFVDLRVAPGPTPYSIPNGSEISVKRSTDRDGTLHANVRIQLSYYATIDGKVTSPEGVPMDGCLIEMFRETRQPLSERESSSALHIPGTEKAVQRMSGLTLSTNDQGEYHAAHLEPGTYYVKCWGTRVTNQQEYRETFYPSTADIASAGAIRVAAGERARADIRISVEKGVRIAGGLSVQDGSVSLRSDNAFSFRFFAGVVANGRYSIDNVLPGKYLLIAQDRDGIAGIMQPIEVSDRNIEDMDVALQPFPELAGTVKFAEGCKPVPIRVRLITMIFGHQAEATSDAEGHFVLHHVPPATFAISVSGSASRRFVQPPTRVHLGDKLVQELSAGPARSGESLLIEMPCGDPERQK